MEKPPAATPAPAQAACAIKGNISRKGDEIYLLPGTSDYDRAVIDTGSGERMFCSEDEAKSAGWRSPQG
ncbi:nuclease [Methylobacterium sp. GXF4]|nr:nuclease [Methylobacterium sp. GXF4]